VHVDRPPASRQWSVTPLDARRPAALHAQPTTTFREPTRRSMLLDQLQQDLNASRKAKDAAAVLLLGTIVSDAKNRAIELRRDLTDDDVIEVLRRGIKRRRESIEMYTKGAREELAEKERAEVTMLERYLPAQPGDDEIRAAVREAIAAGAANVGAAMSAVMPRFKGKVEGGTINAIVREELARK
jgi:uncharacterized protein YqeY